MDLVIAHCQDARTAIEEAMMYAILCAIKGEPSESASKLLAEAIGHLELARSAMDMSS